ncbi:hypothetical protein O3Q52_23875 [Streptomyces sp. ActVer]|nr:hypothetical protein [Streptomyces sp. ActVer]MCZ4511168.1 hypothetical protein [Streptomyces sp. ActVer]
MAEDLVGHQANESGSPLSTAATVGPSTPNTTRTIPTADLSATALLTTH